MKYIDSHAHYLSKRFDKDRNDLLIQLFEQNTEKIIECGTNSFYNKKTIQLAEKYNNIYAVIGFFPMDVTELENPNTWNNFKKQLQHKKVLAIGEIGLDYHHKRVSPELQKKWFKKQLELAKELDLPVCIHSREAEEDTVKILKEFGSYKGVIHCYAYGIKTMKTLSELGYSFGIGGTSTYLNNKDLREAIQEMPLERIVLETDCPYLSPAIVKNKRNDSSNIKYVIEELSKLKHTTEEEIIKQTNKNIFNIYTKMLD